MVNKEVSTVSRSFGVCVPMVMSAYPRGVKALNKEGDSKHINTCAG